MAGPASSSSSPFASAFTYDAFLSFRGEDTRFGFTGNLYTALKGRGINAFIDDIELGKGKEIASALVTAIERSRTAIVVLSPNYASSSYCLDELVMIMERVKGQGRLVIPVFYHVDPSTVRHQKGAYECAFYDHERKFSNNPEKSNDNMERLQKWRMALQEVAGLYGYVFTNGYRHEHDFIVKIVERVSREITRAALPVVDQPVELDSQVQNETGLLNFGSNDVRMVRNHGINGIGHSTATLSTMADCIHHAADNTNVDRVPNIANAAIANNSTTMQPQAIVPTATTIAYAMPFPDISKIEMFEGQNFKRWQERVLSLLDMHGVVDALTNPKPDSFAGQEKLDDWIYANKICRCTILSTLSNELFDVYCSYKEANKIWESMILKYNAEDAGRQKFVIRKYYKWEMTDDKDIQVQINEYHKLLEDLKAENIILQDEFVAGLLVAKLPDSWKDYKQQLKNESKQLCLADLITHITIEDTSRKEIKEARAKTLVSRANMLQTQEKSYNGKKSNFNYNKPNNIPRAPNPTFKRTGGCFVCESPGHRAAQCYKRANSNINPSRPKQV